MDEVYLVRESVYVVPGYHYGGPGYEGVTVTEWCFEYSDGFIERIAKFEDNQQ
jgi:hypothetical protein